MKILLVPAIAVCVLSVAACDNDEPDVVVQQPAAAEEGDSVSLSVGDGGVSFSSEDNDGDGSGTAVSVGDDGVSVRSED